MEVLKNEVKQPKKATEEKIKFSKKIAKLKGVEFENLQDFITALDGLN